MLAFVLTAAVAGASGYAGGELIRLIADHPELTLGAVTAEANAGARLGEIHRNLGALGDRRLGATDADDLATADIVFLALPHGASGALARALPPELLVVDLGADYRLESAAAWNTYYPGDWAGVWTYGMPELPGARQRIAESVRVANPGCYPTSVILGMFPLLAAGLAEPDDVVVVAASGVSGAGRKPSAGLLPSDIMGSVGAYKVGGTHQHTPEIEQALAWAAQAPATVSFTPLLAPMPRGILAVTSARCEPGVTTAIVHDVLTEAYLDEPFVQVVTGDAWPASGWTAGGNGVAIRAAIDAHAGRVVVVAAIDNLGKGAAGQALKNANIMLGLPETAGLTGMGVAP